jgi:WD40 repeat protein
MATGSLDGTARIWDAGGVPATWIAQPHLNAVQDASFSPDGQHLLTASDEARAFIWDAGAKVVLTLSGHQRAGLDGGVKSARYSRDGRRVITAAGDKTARIWDAATGAPLFVLEGHKKPLVMAAFSPDGHRAVTTSNDETVRIWDTATGKEIAVLDRHPGHPYAAFSPDGRWLVTVASGTLAGAPSQAYVWNATTFVQTRILPIRTGGVRTIAFDAEGRRLVAGYLTDKPGVFDFATGAELATLSGHIGWVFSAAFSSDGRRIVTASADKTAKLWDATTGAEIAVLTGHAGRLTSATFSPDGTRVSTSSEDQTARVWDVAWATGPRGATLRDRICRERLAGASTFTPQELADPFLRGLDGGDAVARDPCLRRGPLHWEYYTQAAGRLRVWAGDLLVRVQSATAKERPPG